MVNARSSDCTVCMRASVCKPEPVVSHDPTNSQLKSVDHLGDGSNSIIACSGHHTRAVPYLIFSLSLGHQLSVCISICTSTLYTVSCGHSKSPCLPTHVPAQLCHSAHPNIHHTLRSEPPPSQLATCPAKPNSSFSFHTSRSAVSVTACTTTCSWPPPSPTHPRGFQNLFRLPKSVAPHNSRFDGLFRAETNSGVGVGRKERNKPFLLPS